MEDWTGKPLYRIDEGFRSSVSLSITLASRVFLDFQDDLEGLYEDLLRRFLLVYRSYSVEQQVRLRRIARSALPVYYSPNGMSVEELVDDTKWLFNHAIQQRVRSLSGLGGKLSLRLFLANLTCSDQRTYGLLEDIEAFEFVIGLTVMFSNMLVSRPTDSIEGLLKFINELSISPRLIR